MPERSSSIPTFLSLKIIAALINGMLGQQIYQTPILVYNTGQLYRNLSIIPIILSGIFVYYSCDLYIQHVNEQKTVDATIQLHFKQNEKLTKHLKIGYSIRFMNPNTPFLTAIQAINNGSFLSLFFIYLLPAFVHWKCLRGSNPTNVVKVEIKQQIPTTPNKQILLLNDKLQQIKQIQIQKKQKRITNIQLQKLQQSQMTQKLQVIKNHQQQIKSTKESKDICCKYDKSNVFINKINFIFIIFMILYGLLTFIIGVISLKQLIKPNSQKQ